MTIVTHRTIVQVITWGADDDPGRPDHAPLDLDRFSGTNVARVCRKFLYVRITGGRMSTNIRRPTTGRVTTRRLWGAFPRGLFVMLAQASPPPWPHLL